MAKSERVTPVSIVEGQPRGFSGPSDIELDGSILGGRSGFCYATGREKQSVGDWGLAMLRGRTSVSEKTKKHR